MSVLENIQNWRKRQNAAYHLRTLSDRALADIGISRNQIDDYVRKNSKQY